MKGKKFWTWKRILIGILVVIFLPKLISLIGGVLAVIVTILFWEVVYIVIIKAMTDKSVPEIIRDEVEGIKGCWKMVKGWCGKNNEG